MRFRAPVLRRSAPAPRMQSAFPRERRCSDTRRVVPLAGLRMTDVESVGGKNASLGEMISQLAQAGVRVPGGFATTAEAFRETLAHKGLAGRIATRLASLDVDDVAELARAGAEIRRWIVEAPLPRPSRPRSATQVAALESASPGATWAVRSSATAEDLPDASFAGQQETFLNISGVDNILHAVTGGFRLPLQRPRDRLPRPQGLRRDRGRALRRRSSAWCAATAVRRASCSRSTPSPASRTSCSSPRPTDSAKRSCRVR